MTDDEIRETIIEALAQASVYAMDDDRRERFRSGNADFDFETLEMDSLARMEMCIAIETRTGVSIAPDEIDGLGSLNGLVARVRRG